MESRRNDSMRPSQASLFQHPRITVQNLITIDPTAIVRNFKVISEQLEILSSLSRDVDTLINWKAGIQGRLDNLKLHSEKNNSEVRNLIRNQSKRRESALPQSILLLARAPQNQMKQKSIHSRHSSSEQHQNESLENYFGGWFGKDDYLSFKQNVKGNKQNVENKLEDIYQQLAEVKGQLVVCDRVQSLQQELAKVSAQERQTFRMLQEFRERFAKLQEKAGAQPPDIPMMIRNSQIVIEQKIEALATTTRKKTDQADLIKLEELLANMIEQVASDINKRIPSRVQTKKALIFLQKRINRLHLELRGEQGQQNDPLLAGKIWCLSCHKTEGKVKVKNSLQTKQVQSPLQSKPLERLYSPIIVPKSSSNYIPQTLKNSLPIQSQQKEREVPDQNSPTISNFETSLMCHFGNTQEPIQRVYYEYINRTNGGIRTFLKGEKAV